VLCWVYKGGRSVDVVRLQTKGHGVCLFVGFISTVDVEECRLLGCHEALTRIRGIKS
jgi:hypothetical protein